MRINSFGMEPKLLKREGTLIIFMKIHKKREFRLNRTKVRLYDNLSYSYRHVKNH